MESGKKWLPVMAMVTISALVLMDSAFKVTALRKWSFTDSEPLLGLFDVALRLNKGISFSMFAGAGDSLFLGLGGIFFALALFVYCFTKRSCLLVVAGTLFVCSGAIGNSFDRIALNAVVDFLGMPFLSGQRLYFNIADVYLVLGFPLLMAGLLMEDQAKGKREAPRPF